MKKKLARLALLGFAASLAAPAFAAPPPDVFKDAQGNVYIIGSVASSLGQSARAGTSETLIRRLRAGFCGEVRISETSTLPNIGNSWTLNSTTRTRANLVSITDRNLLPRCSGNAFAPVLSSEITTSGGYIDNTGSTPRVFLVGFTPGISYDTSFNDVNSSQSIRPNACGFFRISNTAANPIPASLTLNSTNYTVASLPVADPPLCNRAGSNGNYVEYRPVSWN